MLVMYLVPSSVFLQIEHSGTATQCFLLFCGLNVAPSSLCRRAPFRRSYLPGDPACTGHCRYWIFMRCHLSLPCHQSRFIPSETWKGMSCFAAPTSSHPRRPPAFWQMLA